MNKIHSANIFLWGSVFGEWDKVCPLDSIGYIEYDDWLEITYGILREEYQMEHKIIDQSKFTVFMLKYPNTIKKISYE